MLILFLFLFSCNEPVQTNEIPNINEPPGSLEIFGDGIISRQFNERDMAITPEGDEIVFTLGNHNHTQRALVHLVKQMNRWTTPEILSFSGIDNDIEPFFSPDGKRLFFASNRSMNDTSRNDYNIWVARKTNNGWGSPVALPEIINSSADEFYPAVSANGNVYFTATRINGIGKEDIFRSEFINGEYQIPVSLDSNVNSQTYEFNAFVSPDESLILFSSYGRSDDMGGGDLYLSQKDDSGNWTKARHLGDEINSDKLDYCPFVHFQSQAFYFTSQRTVVPDNGIKSFDNFSGFLAGPGNGMGDIYWIDLAALNL